ncbi:hypothetical protein LUZ61_013331 [Rhynchospora tenuis]|uniref:F-box domain-containing protein n=1 Tax=Rhynchospora tenuis TaxID=198213 RepID=A0AAD5W8T3_9POAL|nr:hypothetical protein LUZ61_013331 [Rhynchospora tenuis]
MATSPIDDQIDRLSSLPDDLLSTILSFLPIRTAARTSVLCRRFRHLWQTSPSLHLISRDFCPHYFAAMVDSAVLRRSPSYPLLSLRLELSEYRHSPQTETLLPCLFHKACSLGLRHLTIEGCKLNPLSYTLFLIFSVNSLTSLSLPTLTFGRRGCLFPSAAALTNLKTLSVECYAVHSDKLNLLLSQLCSLEDLSIGVSTLRVFNLSSQTIKILKLTMLIGAPELGTVDLRLPSLELLHIENDGLLQLPLFQGEIPLLRKSIISLDEIREKYCSAVPGLLNSISHTEELVLRIEESDRELGPFSILLEPGKEPTKFPNLKHLEVTMCFHKHNFEDIVTLIHHSPALESLKLVHKALFSNVLTRKRKRDDWRSMLTHNADGNHNYIHFTNLHIGQHREEFVKLVSKQCTSVKKMG